jgi:hypothetical protein
VANLSALASLQKQGQNLPMENSISESAPGAVATFEQGQIWKIGDINLAVTMVGKTLVHYKQYRTQPKGIQTALTSKPELLKYLLLKKAVLAS